MSPPTLRVRVIYKLIPTLSATVQGDFRGGFLDIAVAKNFEITDRLTLQDINYDDGSTKNKN